MACTFLMLRSLKMRRFLRRFASIRMTWMHYRAAIQKALPDLPPEQRKALSRGFQFPSERLNPSTTMSFGERLPTEEALALLTPSDQSVLKPYRKLLDNEVALRAAMASMSEEELTAT